MEGEHSLPPKVERAITKREAYATALGSLRERANQLGAVEPVADTQETGERQTFAEASVDDKLALTHDLFQILPAQEIIYLTEEMPKKLSQLVRVYNPEQLWHLFIPITEDDNMIWQGVLKEAFAIASELYLTLNVSQN